MNNTRLLKLIAVITLIQTLEPLVRISGTASAQTELKKTNSSSVRPVQKDKVQYLTALREHPCPPASPEEAKVPTTLNSHIKTCSYSFQLVAKALDNGEILWERTLYSRDYNLNKNREAQIIHPVSLAIQKGISAVVKNQKDDEFVVWLERGYLTKPAAAKIYPTDK
jgi:hypothetical protein